MMMMMMTMVTMMTMMTVAAASVVEVILEPMTGLTRSTCEKLDSDWVNVSSSSHCLNVSQTPMRAIPRRALSRLTLLHQLIISKNDHLTSINTFAFAGLPQLADIEVSENGVLGTIGAFAFSDLPELVKLTITKSKHLSYIHPDAFRNTGKLQYLTIDNTGLSVFPDLTKIGSAAHSFVLDIRDNSRIQRVPANAFRGLCSQTIRYIWLISSGITEVASGAFNGTKMHALSLRGNRELAAISPQAFEGSSELVVLDVSYTSLSALPVQVLSGLETLVAEAAPQLKELPPPEVLPQLQEAQLTYPSHCCAFQPRLLGDPPGNSSPVNCTPTQDDFNPCEDIMSSVFQRVLVWVVSVLALLGNAAVLLVLLGSRSKLTVPRFLMCHLAFSDLCMGVYLVVIATVDTLTRSRYYNHAIHWQTGRGCGAAGFFTVFASELSVFTLTAITLERWHTITHALQLHRRLRLRHACVVMAAGWIFSGVSALLPTVGVSSYSKVSICLPMDVDSLASQIYVVSLLLLNILAFLCVCGCYLSIYLTVRKPSSAPASADTRVAKRMAVLVFTDFVCMAPISFFAVSAALKLPLITVSEAKLLLVLFYPINSCSNPFLYAFFTHSFRRDFFLLAARFGLFKTRAQIYRTETSSPGALLRGHGGTPGRDPPALTDVPTEDEDA